MAVKALGLIETKGLVGAIEALDVCLKAAQVNLAGMDVISGGLVTIRVTGDVGAVKAAVAAGETAAKKVGTLISAHVIPRPHSELVELAYGPGVRGKIGRVQKPISEPVPEPEPTLPETQGTPSPEQERRATELIREIVKGTEVAKFLEDVKTISELSVQKLRKIARYISGIRLTGIEISNARKEQLLSEMVRTVLEGGREDNAN
ncbi:MAG TPA: BMC domain-containing protein [Firmicutes bacterium]|nr:BMC domain-containing protein [Bacillota bacterium]